MNPDKISIINSCPLFAGIEESKLEALLNCLMISLKTYEKDEFIFMRDDKTSSVGIVLSGMAYVVQEDFWGKRAILTYIEAGEMFGEVFSCAEIEILPVSVVSAEKTEVMLIDYRKIVTSCTSACIFHIQLIKNMLRILAEKNLMLIHKMEYLSKRTTREKLLSFLSAAAIKAKSAAIEIPFNRQELADYLCIDRSALSRELSLMQKEGLLKYNKNHFELI